MPFFSHYFFSARPSNSRTHPYIDTSTIYYPFYSSTNAHPCRSYSVHTSAPTKPPSIIFALQYACLFSARPSNSKNPSLYLSTIQYPFLFIHECSPVSYIHTMPFQDYLPPSTHSLNPYLFSANSIIHPSIRTPIHNVFITWQCLSVCPKM